MAVRLSRFFRLDAWREAVSRGVGCSIKFCTWWATPFNTTEGIWGSKQYLILRNRGNRILRGFMCSRLYRKASFITLRRKTSNKSSSSTNTINDIYRTFGIESSTDHLGISLLFQLTVHLGDTTLGGSVVNCLLCRTWNLTQLNRLFFIPDKIVNHCIYFFHSNFVKRGRCRPLQKFRHHQCFDSLDSSY